VDSLSAASTALVDATNQLEADIATACANIATDLGTATTNEDIEAACNNAVTAIDAAIAAGGEISVSIQGGHCTVNAEAQASCYASCDVEGECTPGTLDVECDPGELSVECDGSCSVNAVCQGSLNAAANCEGRCEGTCVGTCDGTCVGEDGTAECEGSCDGTCEGTCTGECVIEVEGGIDCGAEARCKGECTGTATAPRCEAVVEGPECEIDASCEAGCEGRATFEAQCTKPKVVVYASAAGAADLVATLEDNYPVIYEAAVLRGEQIKDAAKALAQAVPAVVQAGANSLLCAGYVAANLAGSATAVATASVSMEASFDASFEVSGSVQGSGN
jgi:hypothetical protein